LSVIGDLVRRVSAQLPESWRLGEVQWLFVATLPNAGSTAFGKLLASASGAAQLQSSGEGQWLTPELNGPHRWQADYPVDYRRVRKVWMGCLPRTRSCVVIEKSPPNLCRLPAIQALFSDMPQRLVSFSRDPYAICASWAKRYTPESFISEWAVDIPKSEQWMATLGRVCGQRFKMLDDVSRNAFTHVRYEDLCQDLAGTMKGVTRGLPLIADVDLNLTFKVKDYPAQKLSNMNEAQIATLNSEDISLISRGLAPFELSVKQFGYKMA